MSGYLEDWRIQIRESIGEFAKIRIDQPDLSISHGILPAALLWPILPAIKGFEPAALEAVREVTGDQAALILRAAQFLGDDRLQAASALAEAASENPDLAEALETLNTNLAPIEIVIDAMARAEVTRRGAGDVNTISGQIKGWLVNIGGKVNIDNLSFHLPAVSWAEQQARNLQLILLRRVREIWVKGVLEGSLYQQVKLEIGLERIPDAVHQPWERVLETPSGHQQSISSTQGLLDVFGSSGYAMLILGEPGSGKTTALLELAQSCLEEAESSPAFPIPTVFNLSSWSPQKPFEEWLVEELLSIYQIPRRYSREWIRNDALMLLLDGLDEVRAEQRQACVATINAFREAHGVTYITVCSRRTEYQSLETRLMLGSAILLQPLQETQIEAYLGALGNTAQALRSALGADPALQELTSTPLLLNVMVLAYAGEGEGSIPVHPQEDVEARRRRLFDAYVEKMLRRPRAGPAFSRAQTLKSLAWLAVQMQRHSTSLFLIEQIQPSWLSPEWPRRLYRHLLSSGDYFGLRTIGPPLLIGVLVTAIAWNPIGDGFLAVIAGVFASLIAWIGWGTAQSVRASFLRGQVQPVETLRWSWAKATAPRDPASPSFMDRVLSTENLRNLGWASVLSGAVSIIRFCMLVSENPDMLVIVCLVGSALAVLVGFIVFMVKGLDFGQIRTRLVPNQGIWRSGRNGLLVTVMSGVLAGALAILLTYFIFLILSGLSLWSLAVGIGGCIGLLVGVLLGMRAGGFAFLLHFMLRRQLQKQGILPGNLVEFLDYASRQILLQKVGGGYMFIHRLLSEHFASLEVFRQEPIMRNPEEWVSMVGTSVMDLWRTDLKDEQTRNMVAARANSIMPLVNFGLIDNEVVEASYQAALSIGQHSLAVYYLGHLIQRNELAKSQVLASTADPRPAIRGLAARTLGVSQFPEEELLVRVIDLLGDEDAGVRLAALSALASYETFSSRRQERIIAALRHPSPLVRAGIALLLSRLQITKKPSGWTWLPTRVRLGLQECIADPRNAETVNILLLGRQFSCVKEVAEFALAQIDERRPASGAVP